MKKLEVEYKKGFEPVDNNIKVGRVLIMMTPDINEDYWIMRVKLYKDQAIVAFPKFSLIGVGFAIEKGSWNTNLPYQMSADSLYKHIEVNKHYKALTKERCLEAIKLIQKACAQYEREKAEKTINLNMKEVNNIILGAISTSGIRRVRRMNYSRN
jgi:hypothetical protein